jgi:hypothetical protein
MAMLRREGIYKGSEEGQGWRNRPNTGEVWGEVISANLQADENLNRHADYCGKVAHIEQWRWSLSCRWSETTSLNCVHQRAYCSSPSWCMSMEMRDGIMSTGENSWFLHQRSLSILLAESSFASRRNGWREWWILPCEVLFSYLQVVFTCL